MTSGNAFLKNADNFDGSHSFLAEELLQPMTNRTDVSRTTMWCSHIAQAVVLDRPQRPRVFTRFENKFGSYTSAVRRLPSETTVLSVFERNPMQRVLALLYEDGTAGIHFAAPARHLTESYGYMLDNGPAAALGAGDVLPGGHIIQGWPCHDADGNFMFGANLRTLYANLDGLTYEDGLVISESAAGRMSHTSVEKVTVNLNSNDLTLNLYGTGEADYQGFPEVGEDIKGGILLVRRRINHESILYDLSTPQLRRVNYEGDTVFYAKGTVVDVEIFSNLAEPELDKHPFNRQLLAHHRQWLAFQQWVLDTFSPYVLGEREGGYSPDVAHWYRTCRDTLGGKWRHDRTEFDGVVLRFTIAKSNPVVVGSKLTNRYGGKGVVSQIRPDADMPASEDGRRADLIVNSLGVMNRLNPAQLFESELNFIADHVRGQAAALHRDGLAPSAWNHVMRFLSIVSPQQAEWMEANFAAGEKEEYVAELAGGQPIYIHQPPFFGVVPLEELKRAYEEFGVERLAMRGIEERMVLGSNYYLRLRHEPEGKHSARSAKHLSVNGVPAKNSKGVRGSTEHHSTTPIRFGEQEIQGLMAANQPEALKRLLRLYATDEVSREGLIAELALGRDPFSMARHVPAGDGVTRPVAGFLALLESIGLTLVPKDSEGEDGQQTQQEEQADGADD